MIICSMVPEIWSRTDRILCHVVSFFALLTRKIKILKKWQKIPGHFLLFYPTIDPKIKIWKNVKNNGDIILLHMCTINQDHMIHSSWDIKCKGQSVLPFWAILPFDPPNNPKNQNFEKKKKMENTFGDIIILHLCITNDDHMMYGSWDTEHNRQNFLSFQALFYPFNPLQPRKLKFWNNEKNPWRYYHFEHEYH